jgi:hypothetical protein
MVALTVAALSLRPSCLGGQAIASVTSAEGGAASEWAVWTRVRPAMTSPDVVVDIDVDRIFKGTGVIRDNEADRIDRYALEAVSKDAVEQGVADEGRRIRTGKRRVSVNKMHDNEQLRRRRKCEPVLQDAQLTGIVRIDDIFQITSECHICSIGW